MEALRGRSHHSVGPSWATVHLSISPSTNGPIGTTRTRPASRTMIFSSYAMLICVPGSPIDCADTIPADSFASIACRSNFSQIFVRTSFSRFLDSLSPWIFFAISPMTDRGSHRPISLSPSAISSSPDVSGGAFTGIVRGVSGSASAAFAAAFRPRGAGFARSFFGAGFGSGTAAPSFLRTFSASFFGMNFASRSTFEAASFSSVKPASARSSAVFFEIPRLRKAWTVAARAVLLDLPVLEGVDQPALHVAGPGRPDGGVDEPFAPAHRVEEVLSRIEAALVRRLDESLRLRAEVAFLEVRQGAVPVAATQALASDRLLSDRPGHLGQVQHRAPRPGSGHDDRAVLDPEVFPGNLAGLVPRASEDLHRLDLERLLERAPGHLLELPALVRFHEALDFLDRGLEDVRNLLLRFLGDIFVVDAGREASDHDRPDRHLRRLVDEHPRRVGPVVPGEFVDDLSLERPDRVLVDRPRADHALLDDDEGVFLLQFLQPDVAFRRDRRLERHAQIFREDRGEQGLAGPELLPPSLDVGGRKVADVDLSQDVRDLLPRELALLVRQEERPGDVVVDASDDRAAEPRGEDVLLDPHEDARLGAGLLALQDVQVHLVPIEVSVVRRTDREIEAERLVRHHPDLVGHHRHPVQRRLPVEQDDVAVDELPLDRVAELDRFRNDLGVLLRHPDSTSIRTDHVIHAGDVLPERS